MSENTARIRASDEERERVAALVRTAMSEGRLSLAEGEQRLAEVYAAAYRDELPRLTEDLPTDPPPRDRAADRPGPGWRYRAGPYRGLRGVGVLALAAAIATVWAVASGSLVGPAIALGIAGILVLKHGGRRHWAHCHRPAE